MPTKHDEILQAIREPLFKARGKVWHFKHYSHRLYTIKGIPDLIGIRKVRVQDLVDAGIQEVGIFVGIEVKVGPKDIVTKEQRAIQGIIESYRGIGMITWEPEQVVKRLGLGRATLPLFNKKQ
jgi:hypothetical protein